MILDRIVLHDFGVYAGRQEVELTPPSTKQPVVLFGGINGTGKTTLLEAIQLCLFGSAAQIANLGGYHDYLRCRISSSRWRQASVTVVFRHFLSGIENRYRVCRTWKIVSGKVRENLEVTRNRVRDLTAEKNWDQHIQGIIPPSIAHLFFFDSERIESYASRESSANLVGAAIRNLLGLNVVERLETDLRILERRRGRECLSQNNRKEVESVENELEKMREQIICLKEEKAALRSRKLDPAKRELARASEKYEREGGELYDRRDKIGDDLQARELAFAACQKRLIELAEGDLPIALVEDSLHSIMHRDAEEETIRIARACVEALDKRDAALVSHMRAIGAASSIIADVEKFCREDTMRRTELSGQETFLNMDPEDQIALRELVGGGIDDVRTVAASALVQYRRLAQEVEAARLEWAAIPLEDSIKETLAARDALREQVAQLEKEYAEINSDIAALEREESRRVADLESLLANNAESRLRDEDTRRFLFHSSKARDTLAQFRADVVRRQVSRIGRLVLESYQSMLHKERLVSSISIHPENFSVTLYDKERHEFPPESLSAGERQLLGISLLWGMAKASGRALPVAVDTPLGRLDRDHRRRLMERYYPHASHQVLLFSTDEEITGEYLHQIAPYVGRCYRLEFDGDIGATHVVDGYLEAMND